FKDRALPAKAVLGVLSRVDVMDGMVEVDRRANTPEALRAALEQKEAELEELQARCVDQGPASLVFSGWITAGVQKTVLKVSSSLPSANGVMAQGGQAYRGALSTLVAIRLWNPPGQTSWAPGQARMTGLAGAPVKLLSLRMQPEQLAPGENG